MPVFIRLVSALTPGDADFVIQTQAQASSFAAQIGDKPYIARHIANAHTLFNVINTLIFLPLIGFLAKLSTLIIRGTDNHENLQVKFIDDRVLNTPPVAIGQARRETKRMGQLALEMVEETSLFLEDGHTKRIRSLKKKEQLINILQREILDFLVKLSQRSISAETSRSLSSLMDMVNNFERIGDHCEEIWMLGIQKYEGKIAFSYLGQNDVSLIAEKTGEFLHFIIDAMETGDQSISSKAIEYEDAIELLENNLSQGHIKRLHTGECAVQPGLIFIDILHSYKEIGNLTYDISETIIGEQ